MTQNTDTLKQTWRSKNVRKGSWALAIITFALILCLGSYLRLQEQQLRHDNILNSARMLAATVTNSTTEPDEILLKVSDLLNVENVLGVKLLQGDDIPLSVGATPDNFPLKQISNTWLFQWDKDFHTADVALRLDQTIPFDWIILRLDGDSLMPAPRWGTLINWIGAPIIALSVAFFSTWIWGNMVLKPVHGIQHHLQEHSGKLANTPLPQELTHGTGDVALLARQIEAMRLEVIEAKAKSDFQARFLHETPYALLRCSINRKVLYANSAARAQQALFGDNSKEFIAPALSELVRKAFYESKEVFGDIRNKDQIITFRAVPVLDAGYVNLYGEAKRHMEDDI